MENHIDIKYNEKPTIIKILVYVGDAGDFQFYFIVSSAISLYFRRLFLNLPWWHPASENALQFHSNGQAKSILIFAGDALDSDW
jgi:hypothetical protein